LENLIFYILPEKYRDCFGKATGLQH